MYNQKRIKIYIYSYCPDDLIGSGYYIQVFKVKNDVNGDIVAIKVYDHSRVQHQIEKYKFLQEIAALQVLDSLNIFKMHFYSHNTYFTYIVTEYCNQGDLENMIMIRGYISENEAILICYQILTGLKDQISKGVIHRDLKPSNILIQKGIYKIANYGHSRMIYSQNQQVQYNVGTTLYNQTQTLTQNKYSVKNDIWNFGVLFYKILTDNVNNIILGKLPWQADREQEFFQFFTKNPIQFSDNIIISSAAKDLINKCLQLDENKRYNFNQLFEHDLFKCFQIKTPKKIDLNVNQQFSIRKLNKQSKYQLYLRTLVSINLKILKQKQLKRDQIRIHELWRCCLQYTKFTQIEIKDLENY
ncbi:unnamed protein product [Paramecium pentaurelia]|uniref:Protein kinase domain-containing protein n=1 Tax=Paramecium pentaurelia TaxID=43138 RepID=A0A8S1X9D3_9CILI|nr:unnamed protein product [Paramecium pentaurelia]